MTEKKEKLTGKPGGKQYLKAVSLIAAIMSFLLLMGTIMGHMDEIRLKNWGYSIAAEYHEEDGRIYAEYYDDKNVLHTYNLNGYSLIHEGDKITLYYEYYVDEAIPESTLASWFQYYAVYGVIFAISMWYLRKEKK